MIARIRNRRARKIKSVAVIAAHHFDDIGVKKVGRTVNRVRHRRDVSAALNELLRSLRDQSRVNQGLVALHIDDYRVVFPISLLRDFGEPVGSGRVIGTCH